MSSRTYDFLKYLQRIALPAVFACVLAILPDLGASAECIRLVGTISTAFLSLFGALMQWNYSKWTEEMAENIASAIHFEYPEDDEKGEE